MAPDLRFEDRQTGAVFFLNHSFLHSSVTPVTPQTRHVFQEIIGGGRAC